MGQMRYDSIIALEALISHNHYEERVLYGGNNWRFTRAGTRYSHR